MKELKEIMALDWAEAMSPVDSNIHEMGNFLRGEVKAGRRFLPAPENIFRAFEKPLKDVKVLIVGQDPYPDPRYPVGLSFSVKREVRPVPQSLKNIYKEMSDDLEVATPDHGDLSYLADQGVMLLNKVLTVEAGKPMSHWKKGWEEISEHAIKVLNERDQPMVAILWGNNARQLKQFLTNPKIKILESVHPSPLSVRGGFYGSKPFSQTNKFLEENDLTPIKWA
jgi:uracil-DNA glycosylase